MRAVLSLRARLGALVTAAIAAGLLGTTVASAADVQRVDVRDDCDPATFNAALGAGTCVGNGGTTFDEFIDRRTERRTVGSWKNNPDKVGIKRGTPLNAVNRGGETHTFTCVKAFGGGIVPLLNDLSGNPSVAELCTGENLNNSFIPAGGSRTVAAPPVGTTLYQCMIHPWMRTTVTVKPN